MKKRRIFSVFCISLLIFTSLLFAGCSSFEKSGVKNTLDDYFDWFEDFLEDDDNEQEDKNKEEDNTSTDNSEDTSFEIILDKDKIIF